MGVLIYEEVLVDGDFDITHPVWQKSRREWHDDTDDLVVDAIGGDWSWTVRLPFQ